MSANFLYATKKQQQQFNTIRLLSSENSYRYTTVLLLTADAIVFDSNVQPVTTNVFP